MRELRAVAEEQLCEARNLVKTRPFLLLWDNLCIADRKSEQRKHSKNTYDTGTMSTLLAVSGVEIADFPLQPLPDRIYSQGVIDYVREDLFPSPHAASCLDKAHLWAIQNILFDFFPALRKHIPVECLDPEPSELRIPPHTTTEVPLSAEKIDESSLDGTLDILHNFLRKLDITEADIRRWGVVFAAGDLLTVSLVESVCLVLSILKTKSLLTIHLEGIRVPTR
jgi:hypothetical protein